MLTKKYMSPIKGLSFIFLILLWELLSYFSNPTTFPSISSIVRTLLDEVLDGEIILPNTPWSEEVEKLSISVINSGFHEITVIATDSSENSRTETFPLTIFPKRGVKNFRLLDGNLKSLSKEFISSYEEEKYYQSCLTKIKKDFAKEITISEEYQKNIIVEFPWSKQILHLARFLNNNLLLQEILEKNISEDYKHTKLIL